MNTYLLLCLVAFGCDLFHLNEAYSKCDPKIVDQIKTIWGKNVPKGLIAQAKSNKKELVIGTTSGYYPHGLECVYSIFKDNKFIMTKVPKKGTPGNKDFVVKEEEGKTVTETKTEIIHRYHVYQGKGVTGVYTCNAKGGDSDSKPDGFIKVKAEDIDENAVEEAFDLLKKINVVIKHGYCEKQILAQLKNKSGEESGSKEKSKSSGKEGSKSDEKSSNEDKSEE